ncbi:MAG: hypothetical protein HC835_07855 [Oscillatoriales cyanobacterium RM2_1_1]|nr:hypothetical protein [Oscillatoriales cyanobacterium SM2_3_0]NJO45544.1 hypothetical protein [Oscillatoriales cyanobacterium RM2_1_1]
MGSIYGIVKQVLNTSYLSIEAEGQLRQILQASQCDRKDFDALVTLQIEAMKGRVRQESREQLQHKLQHNLLLHNSLE